MTPSTLLSSLLIILLCFNFYSTTNIYVQHIQRHATSSIILNSDNKLK